MPLYLLVRVGENRPGGGEGRAAEGRIALVRSQFVEYLDCDGLVAEFLFL